MSLRKKSTMTLEKLSANQANGKRSRGIVTAAGRENILTRQVEICAGQGQALLKESLAGPSPYERAAEIALAHPNMALMQRMEESSFRQIWRITSLLLKIRSQAREADLQGNPTRGQNVHENKAA